MSPVVATATPFAHLHSAHPLKHPLESLDEKQRTEAYEQLKEKIIGLLGLHKPNDFDVFLCHNSKDKSALRQLGEALKERGLSVWLDEWELIPGRPWQDALEDIITTCRCAAVCVGKNGLGPWEQPEMLALLRRFVNEKKRGKNVPIIPVLLPGVPADVALPIFLEAYMWVDLRSGFSEEGLNQIQWGITGVKPRSKRIAHGGTGRVAASTSSAEPLPAAETRPAESAKPSTRTSVSAAKEIPPTSGDSKVPAVGGKSKRGPKKGKPQRFP